MKATAIVVGVVLVAGFFVVGILRSAEVSGTSTLGRSFPSDELPLRTSDPAGSSDTAQQFLVAEAKRPAIRVYQDPMAPAPAFTLPNPNPEGAPAVFLVLNQRYGDWLRVLVPVRPNDTTGWIRLADVTLKTDPYGIEVELARHRLTVWRGNDVIMRLPAGVGRAVTNTPKGVYFVTELLRAPDPTGLYGPYAFGTSAYSDVLNEFAGGNGVIGIHGTDDPAGIGTNVSHGCIRVNNDAITRLAGLVPLGTPVFITP